MNKETNLFVFILKVLFLFLFFLVIYYYISPFLLLFTAKITDFILNQWFSKFIYSVTLINRELEVVTNFGIANIAGGRLAFDINPLKYSYGLPLFFALIFSYGGNFTDKLLKTLFASVIIFFTQVWGISFDIIRHLLFEFNGVYAPHFAYSPLQIQLISYGSQLGFLLLPSLTPILLWGYLENHLFKPVLL